jgi:hypothetical protein
LTSIVERIQRRPEIEREREIKRAWSLLDEYLKSVLPVFQVPFWHVWMKRREIDIFTNNNKE